APSSRPAPAIAAAAPAASAARFHWSCPSTVGVQTVAALNATLARHAPPWRIDWRHLKAIEPAALPALHGVFRRWAGEPVRFKFLGSEQLLQVLADNSPTDGRQVDTLWWQARLALLRVLGDMDQFELVALNYCVTYEVSPPAWEDPKNSYSPMTEDGDTVPPPAEPEHQAPLTLPSRGFGATDVMGASTHSLEDGVAHGELAGELLNSADGALAQVRIGSATTAIELNCRQLLRVDFGAAGDLLNWSMDQKGAGRPVSFRQVNRLVAAFFGVIGITDAARVVLRSD
ncbi:MAG: STAS domain-containing protein, partial [Ottowia sp.]